MQVTWPRRAWPRRVIYLMLIGTLVVIAAAAALGVFFVVQPLTKRIAKLRTAAGAIGSHEGYSPSTDPGTDELGELSAGLDRAHARIRADADRLEERQRALERYLADIAHDLKTPIASLHIALEQAANLSRDSELSRPSQELTQMTSSTSTGLPPTFASPCQLRDGWSPVDGNPSVDLTDTVERVVAHARYFQRIAASHSMRRVPMRGCWAMPPDGRRASDHQHGRKRHCLRGSGRPRGRRTGVG